MARLGVEEDTCLREVETLARGFCIMSEDFRTNGLTDDDLVSIAPAGRVHLQIAGDVYYLAAMSEDFWFSSEASAAAIANRIKDPSQHFSPRTALYNAKDVLGALTQHYDQDAAAYAAIYSDDTFATLATVQSATHSVAEFEKTLVSGPWAAAPTKYPAGTRHKGRVVNITRFGVFVDLELGVTGLIHSSSLRDLPSERSTMSLGQQVRVCVMDLDYVAHRMGLRLEN